MLTSFFLQGLLTHPRQHALWLSPAPSQNFRENIPIHRPRPSAGGALKEKRAPGALVFGSRKASLVWSLFLETSKNIIIGSDSGRCKDALQDHGVWLSRSLTFGSSAATCEGQGDCPRAPPHRELNQNQTEILRCPSPAGPWATVGGSPLNNDYIISNFRETFANKNVTFANSKKTFARVHNITWTVFAIKTLYQDLLDRLPVVLGWFYKKSWYSKNLKDPHHTAQFLHIFLISGCRKCKIYQILTLCGQKDMNIYKPNPLFLLHCHVAFVSKAYARKYLKTAFFVLTSPSKSLHWSSHRKGGWTGLRQIGRGGHIEAVWNHQIVNLTIDLARHCRAWEGMATRAHSGPSDHSGGNCNMMQHERMWGQFSAILWCCVSQSVSDAKSKCCSGVFDMQCAQLTNMTIHFQ